MRVKTWTPTVEGIERKWYIIDAKDQTLGRVSAQIASLLKGKHKPQYATHMDVGDYVIVINCERIHVTGRRLDQKFYYRHSGYPGGIKSISLRDQLRRYPERVIEAAVRGMLPKNRLGRQMFKKMKIYVGDQHPHEAQQPIVWEGK
jgi:large subunit ribosomal protein L13